MHCVYGRSRINQLLNKEPAEVMQERRGAPFLHHRQLAGYGSPVFRFRIDSFVRIWILYAL